MIYSKTGDMPYYYLLDLFGAKSNARIMEGEVWRLITPVFLHVDISHLLFNSYALYFLGSQVEKIYGHTRMILIYLFSGIFGSIAGFAFSNKDSVGASGAIFGLFGALLFLGLEKPGIWKKYFRASILSAIVINVVYGFINTQIDNSAHIGGLVAGFLACGMLRPSFIIEKQKLARLPFYFNRLLYGTILIAVLVGFFYYGINRIENKMILQSQKISTLMEHELWMDAETRAESALSVQDRLSTGLRDTLYSQLIMAETMLGKYAESETHANELMYISPAKAKFLLGIIHYYTGDYESAKKELTEAKRLNKIFGEDVDNLIDAMTNLKDGK
jgi:rhomboid protease GluP